SSSTGGPAFQEMHSCERRVRVRTIGDPALQAVTSFMAPRSRNPKGVGSSPTTATTATPRDHAGLGVLIEARMLYRYWQKEHTYRGFKLVRDYSCFAYQIAQNSSQHTRALFFDRDIKRVTELAWDQSVATLRDPGPGQGVREWISLLIRLTENEMPSRRTDDMTHYLGLDWLAMTLTFTAIYLLGNKSRIAFAVMMIGNLF